jgi:hypothetical protein
MYRLPKILTICVFTGAMVPASAYADCKSAATVAGDIFNEVGTQAITAGCAAIKAAGGNGFTAKDLLDCYQRAGFYTDMTSALTTWWNTTVGKNGWGKIGARHLADGAPAEDGTLIGTSGRQFVTFPMKDDTATLTITERDGKAKTNVVICKHLPNDGGKWTELTTVWFNDTNDRQKEDHEKRTVQLKDVAGTIVSIKLDAKSVTNKFAYSIKLD